MYDDYKDLRPEREQSELPKGYRHFKQDELFEFILVEIGVLLHKIKLLLIGGTDNE